MGEAKRRKLSGIEVHPRPKKPVLVVNRRLGLYRIKSTRIDYVEELTGDIEEAGYDASARHLNTGIEMTKGAVLVEDGRYVTPLCSEMERGLAADLKRQLIIGDMYVVARPAMMPHPYKANEMATEALIAARLLNGLSPAAAFPPEALLGDAYIVAPIIGAR